METELAGEHPPTGGPPEPTTTTTTVDGDPGVGDTTGDGLAPETFIDEVDRLLDEVESALARLDDGTYGHCAECGSAIDDSRLAAAPTARTCANCGSVPADD
jgi:DnaK suppressor protein